MVTMLFAVEGGGFFSSSASGYSDGLTLLLLGRKNEERLMRVSPWNQYQLVEQDLDPDVQLASKTNRVSRRCASFVCFGRASAGLDGHSPPRVGPAQQSDPTDILSASEDKICSQTDSGDENGWKVFLKSSLKKNPTDCAVAVHRDTDACETRDEERSDATGCIDTKKVQWTDACGRDLAEVREFEPSSDEESSDDEFERDGVRRCQCVIQ